LKPIKTTQIGCYGNVPLEIENSDRSSTAIVLPTLQIW